MREKFSRFMMGRYGTDDYSKFLLGSAVALMVLNLFLRIGLLNTVVMVLLIYVYIRMFSKNIQKRYEENQKYLHILTGRSVWQQTDRSIISITVPAVNRRSVYRREKVKSVLPVPNAERNLQRRADRKSYVWIYMY